MWTRALSSLLASLQEVPPWQLRPLFLPAATMADADPEAGRSTVWYSILVQSLFVVPTVAYLLMEKETEAVLSCSCRCCCLTETFNYWPCANWCAMDILAARYHGSAIRISSPCVART